MSFSKKDHKEIPAATVNSNIAIANLLHVPASALNSNPAPLDQKAESTLIILGKKACDFANQGIEICYTHPKFQAGKNDLELTAAFSQSDQDRENLHWMKGDMVDRPGVAKENAYACLQEDVQQIIKIKRGQCFEYSVLTFNYILEQVKNNLEKNVCATLMTVEDGDHTFIILDKSPSNSKFDDQYYPFSHEAVVIDAWDKQVYCIREIIGKLKYPVYDQDKLENGVRAVAELRAVVNFKKELTAELSTDNVLLAEKNRLAAAASAGPQSEQENISLRRFS